ncbi:hypothetical protein RchiOBHm_Chr4g0436491 [Rosa chinensis]|uniref:Uncharacterized protein n=1 Tax=Rosa chinensis TaxID=74649 RepID=A0A2P6R220_ROSCH|nr:hypothetical protein RchiOBHm_Chr4g0436491 [Rosa chinensis]
MMDSSSGNHKIEKGGTLTSSFPANGDMFGRVVNGTGETEGKDSWPNPLFRYIVNQSKTLLIFL